MYSVFCYIAKGRKFLTKCEIMTIRIILSCSSDLFANLLLLYIKGVQSQVDICKIRFVYFLSEQAFKPLLGFSK